MGSVDNSLFQEKIKNFNSSVSDFSVRIPSKNGANDDLKFFEKFFGVGEKTDGSAFFSSFHSFFCFSVISPLLNFLVKDDLYPFS